MSNDKVRATFHPGVAPEPAHGALLMLLGAAHIAAGVGVMIVNQIERIHILGTKRYNAAHPPPPGARQGSSWVAKRSQDIDE